MREQNLKKQVAFLHCARFLGNKQIRENTCFKRHEFSIHWMFLGFFEFSGFRVFSTPPPKVAQTVKKGPILGPDFSNWAPKIPEGPILILKVGSLKGPLPSSGGGQSQPATLYCFFFLVSWAGRPISAWSVPLGPGIDTWRACRFVGCMLRTRGLVRFLPCDIGEDHCRLRLIEKCGRGQGIFVGTTRG